MRHLTSYLLVLSLAGTARAETAETIVIVDDGRGGIDELVGTDPQAPGAARAIDAPAFATIVRVDDRELENPDLAAVLADTVGTSVRSLGGLGSFSSLSVRGAAPGHTLVMVDGIPLSRIASVTTDIGPFTMSSFSELSMIRGGALDLRTGVGPDRDGRPLRLSMGLGSFGARHAAARWLGGNDDGTRGEHLTLTYDGARGDFPYFHDGGTNLNPNDDRTERRTNNDYSQLGGNGRIRWAGNHYRIEAGARGMRREQGIPGSVSMQSETARLETSTGIGDIDVEYARPLGLRRVTTGLHAYGLVERQRYRDRDGEIGLAAQDRRYRLTVAGARARLSFRAAAWQELIAIVEAQRDYFREQDLLATIPSPRTFGARTAVAGTVIDELAIGDLRVIPSARVETLRTIPLADAASGVLGPMDLATRTETYVSPSLSARYLVTPTFAIKSNMRRYFRAPTVLEMFGDRGFIVGNPALLAEKGTAGDLGFVLAPDRAFGPLDRFYVETAAFAARAADTIALSSGGPAARAQNIGDSLILGGELVAQLRVARAVTLSGNYTHLASRQNSDERSLDGKQLPQRPRHDLYLRSDLARRFGDTLCVVWTDGHLVGENFTDVANLRRTPARYLFGAGAKLAFESGLRLGIDVKNLADARVQSERLSPPPAPDLTEIPRAISDVGGYPLPGRTLFFTLEWEPKGNQ